MTYSSFVCFYEILSSIMFLVNVKNISVFCFKNKQKVNAILHKKAFFLTEKR